MNYNLQTITDYVVNAGSRLPRPMILDIGRSVHQQICRFHTWDFLGAESQITAVADYTTGTVAWTRATKTVTGTSTVWTQAMKTRHIQLSTGGRWYRIDAIASSTSLTTLDPIEEADGSAATYTIRQRYYRLPPDFRKADVLKETAGYKVVWWDTREHFERTHSTVSDTGQVYHIVPAGTSWAVLYNTSTVTMTFNDETVTGAASVWLAARDQDRRFRLPLFPKEGDFRIKSITSDTELELDRPWPSPTVSGQLYQIDPIGEPLFELYPAPTAGNSSVQIYYFRMPPPLVLESDMPTWPHWMNDVWRDATLLRCSTSDPGAWDAGFRLLMGNYMQEQGYEANKVIEAGEWGIGSGSRPSNLPWNYAPLYIPGGR